MLFFLPFPSDSFIETPTTDIVKNIQGNSGDNYTNDKTGNQIAHHSAKFL
jgi:hypothetical protein